MQFREIVNEISVLLDGKVSPVAIKLLVNRVIREISSKVLLDSNVAETSVALVASTEAYALPADFSREISLVHTNVLDYDPWYLFAQKDRTTAGVPKTYCIKGTQVLVNPVPSAAAIAAKAAVSLVYGKQPADLAADTEEPSMPRNWHWVVREGALLQALRSVPPVLDVNGAYQALVPTTRETYERGVLELLTSEANKGRISLTPRS